MIQVDLYKFFVWRSCVFLFGFIVVVVIVAVVVGFFSS